MHLKHVKIHPEKFPVRDCYPFNISVFQVYQDILFKSPVTFFAGENGTGKSTLLEAVTRLCNIHIWCDTEGSQYKYNPYQRKFHQYISVEWVDKPVSGSFFGSSIFQYFSQILDEWASMDPGQLKYFGGKSLLTQSHGQSIMAYFKSRYKKRGLYLLDEPETALSPKTQIELLEILIETGRQNQAQFIISTHSPILLACPGAIIYSFDDGKIKQIEYEETMHYQFYKSFLENRDGYLQWLK